MTEKQERKIREIVQSQNEFYDTCMHTADNIKGVYFINSGVSTVMIFHDGSCFEVFHNETAEIVNVTTIVDSMNTGSDVTVCQNIYSAVDNAQRELDLEYIQNAR